MEFPRLAHWFTRANVTEYNHSHFPISSYDHTYQYNRISSDLRSQSGIGGPSTGVGDYLGIVRVVVLLFFLLKVSSIVGGWKWDISFCKAISWLRCNFLCLIWVYWYCWRKHWSYTREMRQSAGNWVVLSADAGVICNITETTSNPISKQQVTSQTYQYIRACNKWFFDVFLKALWYFQGH